MIMPDTALSEAARILTERRIKRLALADNGNALAGIISRADIAGATQEQ